MNPFNISSVKLGEQLVFIAGPCVIESHDHTLRIAERLRSLAEERSVGLVFKASYDKANRTSLTSFRGPGRDEGLRILAAVRDETGLPLLTDIHSPADARAAGEVVDCLQVPAFLCRQTDLIVAAAQTGKPVSVKRGQFLAPDDTVHIVNKLRESGCANPLLTERGYAFGYHDLVVDLRALTAMKATGAAVVFDATHSLQQPGGASGLTGGLRELTLPLARAAVAYGVDAIFAETHPDPPKAKSDPATVFPLEQFGRLMDQLMAVDELRRRLEADGPT